MKDNAEVDFEVAETPSVDWHHVDLSRLPEPEVEADRLEHLHPEDLPIAICLGSFVERDPS